MVRGLVVSFFCRPQFEPHREKSVSFIKTSHTNVLQDFMLSVCISVHFYIKREFDHKFYQKSEIGHFSKTRHVGVRWMGRMRLVINIRFVRGLKSNIFSGN
jgi:hypothetical protein